MNEIEIKERVKKSYGQIAQSGGSCGCGCGSTLRDISKQIGYSQEELEIIPEKSNMGLGCGNPTTLANLIEGQTVLDLGSGGGIDVFLAARKVGEKGKVIGVDMTPEMIQKAKNNAKKFGYENVEFKLGEIEKLPLEDNSVDVIISNCVINLSPDKKQVFSEAHRVLKPNGKLLISDIVTEEKLPERILNSIQAWVGCVAGAQEKSEYLDTIRNAGFKKVNIASQSNFAIGIPNNLKVKISSIQVEAVKIL